jgi:signal peptidase II|tara:strand:+ start:3869 stop:4363 length:495 start_codon:yes stop_codon:yes gene_type:complete
MKFIKNDYLIKFVIIILIFLIDRFSKIYILNLFQENQIKELYFNSFLNFYLIWNEGVAFGLLNFDSQIFYNIVTFLIIIICIIIFTLAIKSKNYVGYFFAVIFGGAIGNCYDRIIYAAVPDFIDFHINNYHWFIFNVADIFITIGIFCLIFDELFLKTKTNEQN